MPQSNADKPDQLSSDDSIIGSNSIDRSPSRVARWLKRLVLIASIGAILLILGTSLLLYLAMHEPEFYRLALEVDPKLQQENGSQMESQILNLRNSALTELEWSANFSEQQINGWLAWDLNKKFPNLIPPVIAEPRVVINDDSIVLAFQCDVKPFKGVVIIDADVFLTGVINQVGIRIHSIHSGLIPIPVASIVSQIEQQAERAGFELEWEGDAGDNVAILNLPDSLVKPDDGGSYLELETLQVQSGMIVIRGKTHPPDF